MKPAASRKISAPVQLTWSCLGVLYRATAWPEVEFQRQSDGVWVAFEPDPSDEVFASAAVMLGRAEWNRYLDFVPAAERAFLETFSWNRLAALAVVTRCPALLAELVAIPALTAFVAAHVALRGGSAPAWSEASAVYERGGIFGLLEWLGLPATRRTLDTLGSLEEPDVARRLLADLREALWSPLAGALLQRRQSVSERELSARLHVLAA